MNRTMRMMALLAFMLCAAALPALAQDEGGEETADCYAYIGGIAGTVEYQIADTEDADAWETAELDMCLDPGDRVRTGAESGAAILYGDGIEMRMNADAVLTVKQSEEADVPDSVDLEVGELFTNLDKDIMGEDAEFKVGTPSGVVAVRGTEFNVNVDEEGKAKVNVLDGVVAVINDLGEVLAEAGFAAELIEGVDLELMEFDVDAFKQDLEKWKDQISIGAVKDALKGKVDEEKDKLKEKIPGADKIPGGGGLGF